MQRKLELDLDLHLMQTQRRAYWQRLHARSRRLESLHGVEPANVDKTLDELIQAHPPATDADSFPCAEE